VDPFDKHGASPVRLAERERQLMALAGEAVDTEALTGAAFDPAVASWEGIAAAELRAAPQPARLRAYAVASHLTWAATTTRVWAEHVRAFNLKVDTLRGERASLPVEVERQLAHWTSLPVFDQDVIRERKRHELIRDLHRRWRDAYQEHIDDGSRQVAGMLRRGPTWENLLLARQRGGLPAGAPLRRFFAAGWEAAAAPGEALRLAELINETQHPPTGVEIEQLHRLLQRYAGDETFWYRFLTGLGPDGLLFLTGRVALAQPDASYPELGGTVGGIQALLGGGLALASTRRGPAVAPGGPAPAGRGLPAEWLLALARAGRQRYGVVTTIAGSPVTVELYGYQLLGPLLRTGGYDGRFLQTVGGDLVDFEVERGGAGLWGQWLPGLGSHAEALRLDWTGGRSADRPSGFDPVLGLLSALERNPAGALDLFTGRIETGPGSWSDGTPKELAPPPGGHRLPRLDYLLTDRAWPSAWADPRHSLEFLAAHPEATSASPGLAQLGTVLAQAARLDDPRAVNLVELIVYEVNTDERAMGYRDGAVPGETWTQTATNVEHDLVHPALRDSLASIVADYIIDVNAAVQDSGASMPGGLGADFEATHMVRFLADLGKSQPAHETVLAAQTAYAATAYHYYLSGEADLQPDGLRERLTAAEGVARAYGAVAGAVDVGAATADWYAQWQRDLAVNARVADGFLVAELVTAAGADLVSSRASGVGYAAGELAGSVLDDFRTELMVDHSGLSTYRNAVLFGDSRRTAATLAEVAIYHSGQLSDLEDLGLRADDGRAKPISAWDERDREQWDAYKGGPGAATVGALTEAAGSAYHAGVERARLALFGVAPGGTR
jgi:hypothetical protein